MRPVHAVTGDQPVQIAVIVATRNAARNLDRCLTSILEQTATGVRAIVVDGGSTDGTRAIIERHADRLAWWRSEPDRGIYDAWNAGLAQAGDAQWICFLGADDAFSAPDVVERLAPVLATAAPAHRLVYGDVEITRADGQVIAVLSEPWERARRRIGQTLTIPHPGLMHHRSIFETRGVFDAGFRVAGDYEFILRELPYSVPLHVPGLRVARWQEGGVTTRLSTALNACRERNAALAKNGYPPPSWFMRSGAQDIARAGIQRVLGGRAMRRLQRWYRSLA
jgi:glycosyltransferase involved in cell wall biosynthesis